MKELGIYALGCAGIFAMNALFIVADITWGLL